jgi:hypothetical protein
VSGDHATCPRCGKARYCGEFVEVQRGVLLKGEPYWQNWNGGQRVVTARVTRRDSRQKAACRPLGCRLIRGPASPLRRYPEGKKRAARAF